MTARTKDKSRSAQIAAPASKKPDRKDRAPTLAHRAEYYAMRATIGALRALSWEAASRVGARLGALGYRPLGIRKRVVERQIAAAFPDLDHQAVLELARQSYEHLGRTFIETALLDSLGKQGVLGRYALHFHLIGDTMRGSYVIGASIWDSHNRWITIHGSH